MKKLTKSGAFRCNYPWIQRVIVPTLALATIALLIAGCPVPGGGSELSSEKAITAFSFANPAATGVINETAKAIAVKVPSGTDVTALVATFMTTGKSVKVGSTVQVSGITANDFSSPVTYTVTAADGSTVSYMVMVTPVPRGGLVAEYLFSGNAADTSGNGHNGVVHNAIATSDRFGVASGAYYFNNSSIEVSDPPGHLFNPNNSFSISGWLNLANDSALEHFPLIAQDEGPYSTNKWYFNYRTFDSNWNLFNALSFHVNSPSMGGGVRINSDPTTLQLNTWHHVALVRDGATFRFYVDSLLIGNVTSNVVIPEVNRPLTIGYGEVTEYLIGSADDVRIYNRALTAEEVSSLFHEDGWTGGGTPLSSDKTITAFSFASPAATGTIDENAKTIAVKVPSGTDVTALVATFTTTGSSVKVGSTAQGSGATANNYTSPLIYTVTAADGSTASYTVTVTSQTWQTVGSAGFSAGTLWYCSLAIDSSGTPYVAYEDDANSNKATVMRYTGGSWQTVGTAGFSAGYVNDPSIAINPIGTPYIAYKDGGNNGKATVMKYASGAWQLVGPAGFSGCQVIFTSLAIDSTGVPHVAYKDFAGTYKATVRKYTGGSWQPVGATDFSVGQANYDSLAIDSSGTPYLAYEDYGNNHKATVMKYAGGSWQTVGTAGFSAGTAYYTSLAIDPSGAPYVAYQDGGNGAKVTVMKYAGGSWQTVGTAGFSAGSASSTSLAIDSSGTPYIAYVDGGNGGRATVMKYTGGTWQTVGAAGFSAGAAALTSLAIDSTGTPYVAYKDGGNSNKATVMRFK